jgi:tryptophanyl-tRNA synthetase
MKDRKHLEALMKQGAERADYIARKTLTKAKKKVGLLPEVR